MKELEIENARLKKMYAEERLKAEILNEALELTLFLVPLQKRGFLIIFTLKEC